MDLSKESEKRVVSYKECLVEIKKFLIPKATKGSVKSTLPLFLEGLLQTNSSLSENQSKTKSEIQWIVVQRCLNLLVELKEGLSVQNKSTTPTAETLLSIQEQAIVRMMLEIVTYWGVSPNLEEGVGISLEKRSQFASQIDISELKKDSVQNKARKLYTCLKGFISLLEERHELYPLVMSKHFVDIFAILLQLIHSPTYNSHQTPSSIISSPTNGLSASELEFCKTNFDNFVDKIQPGFLVDNLSLLLSVGANVKWLQKICGNLLTKLLLRPNGVKIVLEHTLITGSREITIKSFEKVADLVSSIPSNVSTEEYYNIVGPQIFLLLTGGGGPDLMRASVFIIRKMLKKEPELTRSCILNKVLDPFHRILSQMSEVKDISSFVIEASKEEVIVGEEELSVALDNLSKLVVGKMVDQYILAEIKPVIKALFQIYNFSIISKCNNIQSKLSEILVLFFRYIDQSSLIFKSLIIDDTKNQEEAEGSLVLPIKFVAAKDSIRVIKTSVPQDRDYTSEAGSIVELMKEFKDDTLAGNFFIQLLNEFISLKQQPNKEEMSQRYLILLQVLAILSEHLGVRVLQDIVQLCTLIKILLEDKEDEETITLTMGILDLLLNGEVKIKKEEEILLLDLVDDLDILCGHESEQIAEMASKLKTKITTRDSTWVKDEHPSDANEQYNLQDILKDINDPLIPVRAHGLIMLRRMVLVKDSVTKNETNLQKILDIFQTQLSDTESYIYLTAVRGLSALADIYPDTIIPLLLQQYLKNSLSEQVRLKIGESLLLITKRCGEMLPKYSSAFMNAFLISCKDPLPSMRASGLSNLAELCKQLHFALQPYIREIIDCIVAIVKTDKDEDVRRGSLLVITLLFRGLHTDVFELMADDMKSLFRLLKHLEANDPDDVTRMHAKIALGEINNIMRTFMNVEQEVPEMLRIIK